MKKTISKILLCAVALMASAFALAAPPPERPPSLQQQMIFAKGVVVNGLVLDGVQAQKDLLLDQVTVSFGSGQSDPPVMLKTVLPAGVLALPTPWLQATSGPSSLVQDRKPVHDWQATIRYSLATDYIKKICPAAPDHGGQGGSGCIGGNSGGITRT